MDNLREAKKIAPHLRDETLLHLLKRIDLENETHRMLLTAMNTHPEMVMFLHPTSDDSRSSIEYMDAWLKSGVSHY